MNALLQQYSDIHTVLLGDARKDQTLIMLVTAQTYCNSWLCALAAPLLRYNIGILTSLSQASFSNLKVTVWLPTPLSLSTLIHPVGDSLYLSLSHLHCNFCLISLSLAPFFLLSAIVFQLGYKLRLMYALLCNRRWPLGEGAIRQKDNTLYLFLAYMFLMTGDLEFFPFLTLLLFIHEDTSGGSLDNELMEYSDIINL